MSTSAIAAQASAVAQSVTNNKISTAVAAKTLQAQREQGEAAVKLIQQAANITASSQHAQRGRFEAKA